MSDPISSDELPMVFDMPSWPGHVTPTLYMYKVKARGVETLFSSHVDAVSFRDRALAGAALARLRVATDALKKIQTTVRSIHFVESVAQRMAREALDLIGPLPGDQS